MQVGLQTPESAKQFLLTKLVEEANREGVKITDIERRMFVFSETSGRPDMEANDKFEAEYDSDEYERKIAGLLKKAYGHDSKNATETDAWQQSLSALKNEDFYGLVMVDLAGISRPQPNIDALIIRSIDKRLGIFLATVAAVIGIGVLLIIDPFHSNWIRPGWPRIVLIPVFLGILWWLGERQRRIAISGPRTR